MVCKLWFSIANIGRIPLGGGNLSENSRIFAVLLDLHNASIHTDKLACEPLFDSNDK